MLIQDKYDDKLPIFYPPRPPPPIPPSPGELIGTRINGNWNGVKAIYNVNVIRRESPGTCVITYAKSRRVTYLSRRTRQYPRHGTGYVMYVGIDRGGARETAWDSHCQTNYYWEV